MKVRVKRVDKSLPLPIYESVGAVGFDFLVRKTGEIKVGEIATVPVNLIVEVPEGYMLAIASRSGTPRKKGLLPPHGFGVIDQDYCGGDDEIKVLVYNFSDKPVVLERGEKIAQGIFVRVDKAILVEEENAEFRSGNRGGFGSTG